MTLPSTGTAFGLGDLADEFGIAQTNVSLRGRSDAAGFATPDALSEFAGFTHNSYSFSVGGPEINPLDACIVTPRDVTIYGSNSTFDSNTRFWEDAGFVTPFEGLDAWWSNGVDAVLVDNSGNVTNTDSC